MPSLEAWQLVLVDNSFLSSTHGQFGCTACHQGDARAVDKDAAHVNLVSRPSDSTDVFCGGCHAAIMEKHKASLHASQKGYFALIEKRLGRDVSTEADIVVKFNKECGKCHASCGQCHITRPVSTGGGFVKGHNFYSQSDSKLNCTACHGSRVGAEYFGENEGLKSDVHWIPNVKKCVFCHDAEAMHGSTAGAEHRYDDQDMVRCEDCHDQTSEANQFHTTHWGDLACQVCHSQPYKSCNGCHTGGHGITGSSYMTLKIAKNPRKSANRPYDIVVVRHIPIVRDTYADWGIADLPNFDSEPTWKYATPHNIQRWTAQTDTTDAVWCGAKCHGSDFLLTIDDLDPDEVEANKHIVLTQ